MAEKLSPPSLSSILCVAAVFYLLAKVFVSINYSSLKMSGVWVSASSVCGETGGLQYVCWSKDNSKCSSYWLLSLKVMKQSSKDWTSDKKMKKLKFMIHQVRCAVTLKIPLTNSILQTYSYISVCKLLTHTGIKSRDNCCAQLFFWPLETVSKKG